METDAVRQSVDDGNRKFGAAAARKDYAGIAVLYTDNAKVLPPDAPKYQAPTADNPLLPRLGMGRRLCRHCRRDGRVDRLSIMSALGTARDFAAMHSIVGFRGQSGLSY